MAKVHSAPSVLAQRIKAARVAAGYSQVQLAELLNISQPLVSYCP